MNQKIVFKHVIKSLDVGTFVRGFVELNVSTENFMHHAKSLVKEPSFVDMIVMVRT